MGLALDGAEFGERSGAQLARPLRSCTIVAVGAERAAHALKELGATVYSIPVEHASVEHLDGLDVDAVVSTDATLGCRRLVVYEGDGGSLLDSVRALARPRIAAARLLESCLDAGEPEIACDLAELGGRHLLRVAGEVSRSCLVSVEHDSVSITIDVVDGAVAVANGWVPGPSGPKRLVGLPVLRVLLAMESGKCVVVPRVKRVGRGIVPIAEALETAAHEVLGAAVEIGTVGGGDDGDATLAVDAGEVAALVEQLETKSFESIPPPAPAPGGHATAELSAREVKALVHVLKTQDPRQVSTQPPPRARAKVHDRPTVPPPPSDDPAVHERNTLRPPSPVETADEEERGRIATPSGTWSGGTPPVEEFEVEVDEPTEEPATDSAEFAILEAATAHEEAPVAERVSLPSVVGVPTAPASPRSGLGRGALFGAVLLLAAAAAAAFVLLQN